VNRWGTLLLGTALLTGCTDQSQETLGAAFEGNPIPVSTAQKAAADSSVVVRGTMTEKCPVAGCWFMLRDETGTIKVDTKNAGFVVVDVPLKASLVVGGRVMTNGTHRFIEASGVRY
jgi:uncharacterized protein YdeI (BOF family)